MNTDSKQRRMLERASIHDALVQAKKYLSPTYHNGAKEQFICHALNRVTGNWRGSFDARQMVTERLGNHSTVENWLRQNIGEKSFNAAMRGKSNAVQEYRHRWLDSLIAEFSK